MQYDYNSIKQSIYRQASKNVLAVSENNLASTL